MKALAVGLMVAGMAFALASPAWAGETFGVASFESSLTSDVKGAPRASSHPYALTTTVMFDHQVTGEEEDFEENGKGIEVPLGEPEVFAHIYGNPRDLEANLPAGLVVNPSATSVKCSEAQLETKSAAGGSCPAASAVGIATVYIAGLGGKIKGAVYNMTPPLGVPAELGMDPGEVGLVIHIVGKVRTGGDYGFSADVAEIGQTTSIYGLELTLWGDPSAASHDSQRGICASRGKVQKSIEEELFETENLKSGKSTREYRFSCPVEGSDTPLLTMPGFCTGNALETTLSVDSWQEPGDMSPDGTPDLSDPRWKTATSFSPPVTGCEDLAFNPSLTVKPAPEAASAESPAGLNVDLKMPREESAEGLAEADLRNMTVTLPPGMALSLSAANGLGACTNAPEPGRPEGEIALHSAEPARCPEASELGEAEVVTPLLEEPLKGAVYLAQQETFAGSLIGLYVVVEGGGVPIKLAGTAALDPNTGQITIAFDDLPQLPLGEIRLSLSGGPRAALLTPPGCGSYTTTSGLTPWSGVPAATPSSSFELASGPNGGACPSGAFNPSFTAGTTNSEAGAFSPFSVTISRRDGEQRLGGVRVVGPPGLLGALASATKCPEPQASTGECEQASEIGEASIAAGSGEDPFWIRGGKIYLTGPYAGAPFGLSIAIPAAAGPFDLGKEVVRARVEVDSHTARLVIASDPLPAMAKGVPLDIRTVNMTIGRPGFIFNPTSCAPLSVAGTLESASGASAPVAGPFEVVNCAKLRFDPRFTVSTQAKTSRARGASLSVKVVFPHPGPSSSSSQSAEADIAKVRVILPRRLAARLTTLQQACPDTVFDANPASCPAASIVGGAAAATPVLAHPLTGPVYLVSHGAAFPDLAVVLRGEGIVIYLDGNLDLKQRLTSATFNSIPDIPIDTFTIDFPEGPHSLLAADVPTRTKGSMCGQRLIMPTAITGQNGALKTQATKATVSGCPKRSRGRVEREGKEKGSNQASSKRQ